MNNDNLEARYNGMTDIANKMTTLAEQYSDQVKEIYKTIENLETVWKGIDNITYINTAKSYYQELLSLGTTIDNYAKFLKGASGMIEGVQEGIAGIASKL